eukprot:gene15972-17580_t
MIRLPNATLNEQLRRFFYAVTPSESSFEKVQHVPDYLNEAIPLFMVAVIVEYLVSIAKGQPALRFNDGFSSITAGLMSQLSKIMITISELALYIHMVDKLPAPLEFILSTPSHHRVHHGRNPYCIDKNFGGTLIIWDRLFGTFQSEKEEKVIYGLVYLVNNWNPLYIQFCHIPNLLETFWKMEGWRNKLSVLFKGPSWVPGSPRLGYRENLIKALSNGHKWAYGCFLVTSLSSLGSIFEHKSYAPHLEITRSVIFIAIDIFSSIANFDLKVTPSESSFEKVQHVPDYLNEAIPLFMVAVIVEYLVSIAKGQPALRFNDGFSSITAGLMSQLSKIMIIISELALYIHIVDKLPAPLEFILNTPSHHRVHHGGTLIIWDRIFGTFQPEKEEKVVYGLVHPLNNWNPFYIQICHYQYLLDTFWQMEGLRNKLSVLFKGPGWVPGSPRLGYHEDLPEINYPVEKYDRKVSFVTSIYITLHVILLILTFQELAFQKEALSYGHKWAHGCFLVMSLSSLGSIFEHKSYAPHLEITRSVIFIAIDMFSSIVNFDLQVIPENSFLVLRSIFISSILFWILMIIFQNKENKENKKQK